MTVGALLISKYASITYGTVPYAFFGEISCPVADIPLIQKHHLFVVTDHFGKKRGGRPGQKIRRSTR